MMSEKALVSSELLGRISGSLARARQWLLANQWPARPDPEEAGSLVSKLRQERKDASAILRRLQNHDRQARGRRELKPWYVRHLLSDGSRVPPSEWPEEMVKLKRARVALKRRLREKHK